MLLHNVSCLQVRVFIIGSSITFHTNIYSIIHRSVRAEHKLSLTGINLKWNVIFQALYYTLTAAPQPWLGVKITTTLSPVCPQNLPQLNTTQNYISGGRYDQLKRLLPFLRDESEDCLFLNLYVPKWGK